MLCVQCLYFSIMRLHSNHKTVDMYAYYHSNMWLICKMYFISILLWIVTLKLQEDNCGKSSIIIHRFYCGRVKVTL